MFGKKPAQDEMVETIISDGTEVRGTIPTKGLLRVDGLIDGGVSEADGVIVGETGKVKGDIKAKSVVVGGRVTGNISAATLIELHGKAQVYGDLRAPSLSIAQGVVFEGNCTMSGDQNRVIELEVPQSQ